MTRDPVETSGATLEEAIERALEMLGAREDEVEIRVVAEGGHGNQAQISARMRDERSPEDPVAPAESVSAVAAEAFSDEEMDEQADAAVDFLRGLLAAMDFDADIEESIEEDGLVVELIGEDMGLLIGRHGATLEAIQDLTRAAVKNETGMWPRILVDVEGYQERRRETLESRALSLADKVRRTGQPAPMAAMSPTERKVVHEVLAGEAGVRTESEGIGPDRHIVIHPA